MAQLTIRLLGTFQVGMGAVPITKFESNKVRALLAYLAVESAQAHTREKLVDLLWPHMPPQRANSNLSQALYNLRQLLLDHQAEPAYLLCSREWVQFNPHSDYWLDVDHFTTQLASTWTKEPSLLQAETDGLAQLKTVLVLYQGEFLEGMLVDSSLAFDEWVMLKRQRFQRLALDGLHLLAGCFEQQGNIAQALPHAWRQVELDPLNDRSYRQLMQLLAASDQRSQALVQYERLQALLAEELDLTPEPETVALRDRIRGEGSAQIRSNGGHDNLPALLNPMVGRQQELAELQQLVRKPDCRLLTILGPGGCGKTRLALEVARLSLEYFNDGVIFVPLNPVQSPTSILPAVVKALGLPQGEGDNHQNLLTNYLRDKTLLLVLDGFEHLLEGGNRLAEILQQSPGVKILVTSRIRLNFAGEQLYLITGMRYPEGVPSEIEILEADAVQLLITAVCRARPEYEPEPEELNHLLRVCRQVQGMPLGILLAASWGGTLSVAEIADEIGQSLDFLVIDWADVPARQRSLRATFDHTWELLNTSERSIFQSLSVFRGAFTRRAARVVSGASPYELRALLDHSLIWHKSPGWYEVHELLRQYGREKLAHSSKTEAAILHRYSTHYLRQLVRLGADLKSSQQSSALNSIDLEHENYRSAWIWTAEQAELDQLARVIDPLCLYYDLSLRFADGESACRMAVEGLIQDQSPEESLLLQIRLLIWQSHFTRLLGQPERACQLLDHAQHHLEQVKTIQDLNHSVEAFLALERGLYYFNSDRVTSAGYFEYSLQSYRSLQDALGAAKALAGLGLIAHHAGSFADAVQHYSACLALYRTLGDPRGIANTLIELGHNTLRQGQVAVGQENIQEGITILKQVGDRAGVARGYMELARSCFWTGEFEKSYRLGMSSEPILADLGLRDRQVFIVVTASLPLSHLGKYTDAVTQAKKGLTLAKKLDAEREIASVYLLLGTAYLGLRDFKQAIDWSLNSIESYRRIDQRDELAWALSLMVFAQRGLKEPQDALIYLCQTLEIGIEIRGVYPLLCALCAAALLLVDGGEIERAMELAALAWRSPVVSRSRWFEDIAGRELSTAAQSLPPDVVATAEERGRNLDIWQTATELLKEFSMQIV